MRYSISKFSTRIIFLFFIFMVISAILFSSLGLDNTLNNREALTYGAIYLIERDKYMVRGPSFLSFNGLDPLPKELKAIQATYPEMEIRQISLRIGKNDNCKSTPDFIVIGACEEDNYHKINLHSGPLWRTVALNWKTSACRGTLLYLKILKKWWLVSENGACS